MHYLTEFIIFFKFPFLFYMYFLIIPLSYQVNNLQLFDPNMNLFHLIFSLKILLLVYHLVFIFVLNLLLIIYVKIYQLMFLNISFVNLFFL